MEKLKVKAYTKEKNIVLDAQGTSAVMQLLNLLWQNKAIIHTFRSCYDIQNKTITIKDDTNLTFGELTYIFENVPLQWDGNIDTSLLHKAIFNEIQDAIK